MRIKRITSHFGRDFRAIYECEWCGAAYESYGYDDRNFHDNVIPTMKCNVCGKSRNDIEATEQPTCTENGVALKVPQPAGDVVDSMPPADGTSIPLAQTSTECEFTQAERTDDDFERDVEHLRAVEREKYPDAGGYAADRILAAYRDLRAENERLRTAYQNCIDALEKRDLELFNLDVQFGEIAHSNISLLKKNQRLSERAVDAEMEIVRLKEQVRFHAATAREQRQATTGGAE